MKKQLILEALLNGQKLTVLGTVRRFNTVELRKRISELRREGFHIKDEWETNKQTKSKYKVYYV